MKRLLREQSYILFLTGILIGLMIVMSVASPYFLSWKNFRNVLNQSAIYLILTVGMTFVICAGMIDLSVGSILGFTGMIMGSLILNQVPLAASILIGLAVSAVIGAVNGAIVAYGQIHSFIVTLGMTTILRGIILIVTNSGSMFGFGAEFAFIGSGKIGPVNVPILLSLIFAAAASVVLHHTRFGNYCLFAGTNEKALNRSGVSVKLVKIKVFTLCGLAAGIAGMIVTARLNSAEPLAGQGYEMDAIAAAVLGGTSMQGGKGTIIGSVIACLILSVMKNGLTLLAISSHYQEILTGVILVVAVLISTKKDRKKSEV